MRAGVRAEDDAAEVHRGVGADGRGTPREQAGAAIENRLPAAKSQDGSTVHNCGEEYVDAKVAARLLRQAEAAAKSGARLQVREYAAA